MNINVKSVHDEQICPNSVAIRTNQFNVNKRIFHLLLSTNPHVSAFYHFFIGIFEYLIGVFIGVKCRQYGKQGFGNGYERFVVQ